MGLKEVAEELKSKISEAEKIEEKEIVEDKPQPEGVVKEDEPEVKEEVKAEEKKQPDPPKKTPEEYAEERRATKAAAKLAEELATANARIASLEAAHQPDAKQNDQEPSKSDDPQAWNEWKLRQADIKQARADEKLAKVESWTAEQEKQRSAEILRTAALSEIQGYEAEVRQSAEDYDDVKKYYANMLAASIKIVNPKITNERLQKVVEERMISRAAELYNDGHVNPIAAMYQEAKSLGYQGSRASSDEGKEEKEIKPDLSKVAANRARNAGTAAAQGKGERGEITKAVAASMTNDEFRRLPVAERKRLMASA